MYLSIYCTKLINRTKMISSWEIACRKPTSTAHLTAIQNSFPPKLNLDYFGSPESK